MEAHTASRAGVSEAQLKEAEESFKRLLFSKRFPREWIETNAADVFGQARTEFAARLVAGRDDDTVPLLITIAYRRAQNLLDAQRRRPPVASIDSVIHLADEGAPTPEEEAIDHDRSERIVTAMSHLPEKDCKLLALVYFEGMSIREAGSRLGWRKSAADRHHAAALKRLAPMLGERRFLGHDIALPATIVVLAREGRSAASLPRSALAYLEDAWRRLLPFTEPGSAASFGSGGRVVATACGGALIAACGLAATGVSPILKATEPSARTVEVKVAPAEAEQVASWLDPAPAASGVTTKAESRRAVGSSKLSPPHANQPTEGRFAAARDERTEPRRATEPARLDDGSESAEEFGVMGESPPPSAPSSSSSPSGSAVSSAVARPGTSSPSSSGESSAPDGSGGSAVGEQFGM